MLALNKHPLPSASRPSGRAGQAVRFAGRAAFLPKRINPCRSRHCRELSSCKLHWHAPKSLLALMAGRDGGIFILASIPYEPVTYIHTRSQVQGYSCFFWQHLSVTCRTDMCAPPTPKQKQQNEPSRQRIWTPTGWLSSPFSPGTNGPSGPRRPRRP